MSVAPGDNLRRIYELVNQLSVDELDALGDFLKRPNVERGPVERAFLRASLRDPENLSEEDRAALREAEEALAAGDVFTQEEIERDMAVSS